MKILSMILKYIFIMSLVIWLFLAQWLSYAMPKQADNIHGYIAPIKGFDGIVYVTPLMSTIWTIAPYWLSGFAIIGMAISYRHKQVL